MPVASPMTGAHRDCPVLASVAQWPEIQPLVSRDQIVLLTFVMDGQMYMYVMKICRYVHVLYVP